MHQILQGLPKVGIVPVIAIAAGESISVYLEDEVAALPYTWCGNRRTTR